MLTNPPCTGTLTSKHWPCQMPRCVAIAGRFALSKPAETGTSVTSAAAECSAVVADVKNGAGRAPLVTEEYKQGGSETVARKNVTSRRVGKIASKALSSRRSSKTTKSLAGSALSQRPSKWKSPSVKDDPLEGLASLFAEHLVLNQPNLNYCLQEKIR